MREAVPACWIDFWQRLDDLERMLRTLKARDVNNVQAREIAKAAVQIYFRDCRARFETSGAPPDMVATLDQHLQRLLFLANGRNSRASYKQTTRAVRRLRTAVEHALLVRPNADTATTNSALEGGILATLSELVPTAALSYEQALRDLRSERISWRGTAADLRETLREVLDHLAPDDAVRKAQGFQLEKDQTRPTMKQKARFIVRSRGTPSGSVSSTTDGVATLENSVAALARSVYDRGSISAHIATTRAEARQLKLYVDSLLADLLQVAH